MTAPASPKPCDGGALDDLATWSPLPADLELPHVPASAEDAAQQVQQCEQLVRLRELELQHAREQLQAAREQLHVLGVLGVHFNTNVTAPACT
jgi:hypothetical protein